MGLESVSCGLAIRRPKRLKVRYLGYKERCETLLWCFRARKTADRECQAVPLCTLVLCLPLVPHLSPL